MRGSGSIAASFVLVGAIAAIPGVAAAQGVIYVDAAATGANNGSSWSDAFTDVQAALSAAVSGDQIWVAAGTYTPGPPGDALATYQLRNGVSLYGGFAGTETNLSQRDPQLHETILSGDVGQDDEYGSGAYWYTAWNRHTANSGHVVTGSGTNETAVIDGFTIMAGATGPDGTPAGSPLMYGSGIYIVGGSPTIRQCVFRYNLAAFAHGGAIYVQDGSPTIVECTFKQNYVHFGSGAGIMIYGTGHTTISDCVFLWNRCVGGSSGEAAGAGISNRGVNTLTVTRCVFDANTSTNFASSGDTTIARGAGIHSLLSAGLVVEDCVFKNNWAHAGAGIYTWDAATVVNSVFVNNTVVAYSSGYGSGGGFGAGIASTSAQSDITHLVNCSFGYNHAGEAGGVWTGWNHHTLLDNCVLWGNTATGQEVTTRGAQIKGSTDFWYSCVQGLFEPIPGEDPPDPADYPGCVDTNPLFVGSGDDPLALTPGSPCIDAGDNAAVPAGMTTDLTGQPRFVDDPDAPDTGAGTPPIVDMGAYERQIVPAWCAGDMDCNGAVDFDDIDAFVEALSYPGGTGWPFECLWNNADCDGDGDVNFDDIDVFVARIGFGCP